MSGSGNPLLSLPPDQVSVSGLSAQEIDPRQNQKLRELGKQDAGTWSWLWGAFWAAVVDGLSVMISALVGVMDSIMALVLQLVTAAQGAGNASFYKLAAAALTDLTGLPVDAGKLTSAAFGGGPLAGVQALGGDLFNLLQSEFAPAGTLSPDQGMLAAKAFLGFLMNFSVRQGNVEFALSMLPESFRMGDGARAYGEQMAKNIGLGRLGRAALRPLVQTTIADPLTWKLNELYRPKMMGEAQMLKRFFRDPSTKQRMLTDLARLGYSDETINDLIADALLLLSEKEIIEYAFRFGATTSSVGGAPSASVKDELLARGYSDADAQRLIDLQRPQLDKGEIARLFADGVIDQSTALSYMAKLGYDNATAPLALQAHASHLKPPHHIGLGEYIRLYEEGNLNILEFEAALQNLGFSPADVQLLQLDVLSRSLHKQKKIGLASIKAAFKAGTLLAPQAEADIEALGYSKNDAALILSTFATKPKTPAPPATGT
jgi:hypothetical protein